jgi:hypothetical protein
LNTQRQRDLGSVLQNRVVERNFQLGCGLVLAAFSHKKPELLDGARQPQRVKLRRFGNAVKATQ